jgi:hypothetical protein
MDPARHAKYPCHSIPARICDWYLERSGARLQGQYDHRLQSQCDEAETSLRGPRVRGEALSLHCSLSVSQPSVPQVPR